MGKRREIISELAAVFLSFCLAISGYFYANRALETVAVPEIPMEIETTAATAEPAPTETTEAPTEPPTEPEVKGKLFLTVSEINFSVVGEQENIYAGTVPLEDIVWESGDENIISVENGVLTAKGVGKTWISATCEDQAVSCWASCLALDRGGLSMLGQITLRTPKRIAPQVGDQVLSFYEDAVMLGDSITYGFMKYEARNGRLGSPRCLCRGSLGIRNLLTHNLQLYYQGVETPLEDVLASVDPQKVFILLGTNDVMVRSSETVLSELDQLLNRVLDKNPDLEIYLQSVFPIVCNNVFGNGTNERITHYNEELQKYAEEKGFHYVPVAPYLQDHVPGFADLYQQDTYHPSYEGVCAWTDALRAYAYIQQIKGEMK